jgi:hypothetical protein
MKTPPTHLPRPITNDPLLAPIVERETEHKPEDGLSVPRRAGPVPHGALRDAVVAAPEGGGEGVGACRYFYISILD